MHAVCGISAIERIRVPCRVKRLINGLLCLMELVLAVVSGQRFKGQLGHTGVNLHLAEVLIIVILLHTHIGLRKALLVVILL